MEKLLIITKERLIKYLPIPITEGLALPFRSNHSWYIYRAVFSFPVSFLSDNLTLLTLPAIPGAGATSKILSAYSLFLLP